MMAAVERAGAGQFHTALSERIEASGPPAPGRAFVTPA